MKSEYLRGIAYALLFAVPAYVLGKFFPIIGGPVFGILLGMCFARLARPKNFEAGISFTGKKILQYAIILLGFEMNLYHVLSVGSQSLAVMASTLATAFLVAWGAGRLLGVEGDARTLIGAGTAICGGSAIAVFIFPFLGHFMGMSDLGFGMWAGTAINDTSSVVAAGYSYSHEAGSYATIVKLTRALCIVPVCLAFALLAARDSKSEGKGFSLKRIFPMFILWFVVASIVNTTGVLPEALSHFLGEAGKFAIVLAMSAIGLNTDFGALLKNGVRPITLGLFCWIAVAVVSLIVQHFIGII